MSFLRSIAHGYLGSTNLEMVYMRHRIEEKRLQATQGGLH